MPVASDVIVRCQRLGAQGHRLRGKCYFSTVGYHHFPIALDFPLYLLSHETFLELEEYQHFVAVPETRMISEAKVEQT